MPRSPKFNVLRIIAAFVVLIAVFSGGGAPASVRAASPRVAYIWNNNSAAKDAFVSMLSGKNFQVDVYTIDQAGLQTTDFSVDQEIIIGDDTGAQGSWPAAAALRNIEVANKPVLGIGNGGSSFFSVVQLFINYGQAWFSSANGVHVVEPSNPVWTTPASIPITGQAVTLFNTSTSMLAVFDTGQAPDVRHIGREPGDPNHFPLIAQVYHGVTGQANLCFTLWGFQGTPATMTDNGKNLFANLLLGDPCGDGSLILNSIYAATPPFTEGTLSYGEWDMSQPLPFDHGFLTAMNDGTRLYLLIDVTEDTTNAPGDYFWVTFDKDRSHTITPNTDINYANAGGNMRYQFYLGPGSWTGLQPSTFSSRGEGFGCWFADFSSLISIKPFQYTCHNHRIWELGFDLTEIGGIPGQPVYMGVRHYSDTPRFIDETPVGFYNSFNNLIQVNLAPLPYVIPAPFKDATIYFPVAGPLEVTQVIQNMSNTEPVVSFKPTAARAYVGIGNVPVHQLVTAFLYGSSGGVDLPGSPLAQTYSAPPSPNRANLGDTANFQLPKSWADGNVVFHVEARDLNGHHIVSANQPMTFTRRGTPNYWVIPLNDGTAGSPHLVDNSLIAMNESYIKAVYPVPNITFTQKPWQVIGTIDPSSSLDDSITALRSYYNNVVIAWIFTLLFTGTTPGPLPDLIYGFRTGGGGLSDPTWYNNGGGTVAAGYYGSSAEGTMAHEFNHDLDRSTNGTWGRHAPGCGAGGPDPNWPWGTDISIHEFGFDTRLPWGGHTVVPSSWPDLMSYCQSGSSPTKWLSTYRWENLFANTYTVASALNQMSAKQALAAVQANSIYISGLIRDDNTGKLDPILVEPGFPSPAPAAGGYSIVLLDSGGGTLSTTSFGVSFFDTEGNPITQVPFNFVLPPTPGVKRIELRQGATVLDHIDVSAAAPVVSVTNPHGGETYTGTQTITWTASDADTPAANLRFNIFYSPDNGSSWLPVANNLSGSAYNVDTNALPKGALGKIKVVVTDGYNTSEGISAGTFTVPDKPPSVIITQPEADSFVPSGSPIHLEGEASDLEDSSIPDQNFVWSLDNSSNLGSGRSVDAVLPDGLHTIMLTVVDSDGNPGTETVRVWVNQRLVFLPFISK